jgi:hypothetical protein
MIECLFTIDYEIYGNGYGALDDLVYEPAERLREMFLKWGVRFVAFVEVAELEKIEEQGSDECIDLVKRQVNDLHNDGFEIALHLHPQWFNARYEQGRWILDMNEYNLCTLPRPRIARTVIHTDFLPGRQLVIPTHSQRRKCVGRERFPNRLLRVQRRRTASA